MHVTPLMCSVVGLIGQPQNVWVQRAMTYLLSHSCVCENAVWASRMARGVAGAGEKALAVNLET